MKLEPINILAFKGSFASHPAARGVIMYVAEFHAVAVLKGIFCIAYIISRTTIKKSA